MAVAMMLIAALAAQDGTEIPPAPVPPAPLARAMENVGFGPLRLATQSPFPALRLSLAPDAPSSLPEGRWELRETLTWSRIWGQADRYLLGFETLNATHSAAYAVDDRTRVEFGFSQSTRFGGKLDGFVRGFHESMGIDQGGRDALPRGSFAFELRGEEGVRLDERSGREASEHAWARIQRTLTEGSDVAPAVAASITVKTDVGDSRELEGNAVEVGGSLSFAKGLGDVHAYLDLALTWHGSDRIYGVELRPLGASVLAALEWSLSKDISVLLQHLWTRGAAEDFGPFSKASHELSLGVKLAVSSGSVLEVAITENLVVFDNSPDFGLHAGLTSRF